MICSWKLTRTSVRHDDSGSIVQLAKVVTNVVKLFIQFGYNSDLESDEELSSATRKLFLCLKEQWLQRLQNRTLQGGKLNIIKTLHDFKLDIYENL